MKGPLTHREVTLVLWEVLRKVGLGIVPLSDHPEIVKIVVAEPQKYQAHLKQAKARQKKAPRVRYVPKPGKAVDCGQDGKSGIQGDGGTRKRVRFVPKVKSK